MCKYKQIPTVKEIDQSKELQLALVPYGLPGLFCHLNKRSSARIFFFLMLLMKKGQADLCTYHNPKQTKHKENNSTFLYNIFFHKNKGPKSEID